MRLLLLLYVGVVSRSVIVGDVRDDGQVKLKVGNEIAHLRAAVSTVRRPPRKSAQGILLGCGLNAADGGGLG
jgi:hypothetical protein